MDTPASSSIDTEDQYKPPLIVDGAGPASRFGLDPTAPVFVPAVQPGQQVLSSLDPLAPEYVPNNLLVARAQLALILGQALPEEYVDRLQALAVPMPRFAPPVEDFVSEQYAGSSPVILTSEPAAEPAQGHNTCRDFILAPKFRLDPKAQRFVPRYDPLAKEFIPANYNSCKVISKRKDMDPEAKPFVPGQMWMDARVEGPATPALFVRWEIINKVFAQVVKQVEALDLTLSKTTTCRALVKQSNTFVLMLRPLLVSKLNPHAKEFVPAPKTTITTMVRRMDARAPTFVSLVPFLAQALQLYQTLVLAVAYLMSLPNTCTDIVRRPSPIAKAFTSIKEMVVYYKDSILDLFLYGALLAIKIIASSKSLVSLGPSPVIGPVLRQRLFVPFLFMALPSYELMKFNGNHLAVQTRPFRPAGLNLPAIALAENVPSLDTIFAGIQLDGASGSLQPQDTITLASSTVANQELETTAGPLIVDSGSLTVEQAKFAQDDLEEEEEEEYDPEAPLQIPPRPSSPNPDNWDRDTILDPEDDYMTMARSKNYYDPSFVFGFPNMAIADIAQHYERELYKSPDASEVLAQTSEEPKVVHEKTLRPSEMQLTSKFDGLPEEKTVHFRPMHHMSFLRDRVPCKSDTNPAVSLAVILSDPKPELAADAANTNFGKHTIITNAFKFVDPVIYTGKPEDRAWLQFLSASGKQDKAIGWMWKFYNSHGTWQNEPLDPDDDEPTLDTLNPNHYPEDFAILNGISDTFYQPTADGFYATAVSMHARIKAKRGAAHRARKAERDGWKADKTIKMKASEGISTRLKVGYTPESMLAEDVREQTEEEYDPIYSYSKLPK